MFAATMVVFALFSRNQAHWRSVFRYDLPLNPLLILPWVHWFSDSKATSGLKKHLIWGVAGSFIVVLLAVGLAIQLGIARRLHIGGWGF